MKNCQTFKVIFLLIETYFSYLEKYLEFGIFHLDKFKNFFLKTKNLESTRNLRIRANNLRNFCPKTQRNK